MEDEYADCVVLLPRDQWVKQDWKMDRTKLVIDDTAIGKGSYGGVFKVSRLLGGGGGGTHGNTLITTAGEIWTITCGCEDTGSTGWRRNPQQRM